MSAPNIEFSEQFQSTDRGSQRNNDNVERPYSKESFEKGEGHELFEPAKSDWSGESDSAVHSIQSLFRNVEDSQTAMAMPDAWEANAWNGGNSPMSAHNIMRQSDWTGGGQQSTGGWAGGEQGAGGWAGGEQGAGGWAGGQQGTGDWAGGVAGGDTATAGAANTSDPLLSAIQQTDPELAQVLTDSQSQMTAQGYAQYEQLVSQNLAAGTFPDDQSLLTASAFELGQQGGSAADVAAAQAVIQNDVAEYGDTATSTFGGGGGSAGASGAGGWGGGGGGGADAGGGDAGAAAGGDDWGGGGAAAGGGDAGGGDAGAAAGGATGGGGTAAGGSTLSNAEAATVQVIANDGGGEESLGSGFFVSSNGLISTDYHVVQGAQGPIQIQTADGQTLEAEPVVTDQANDIAILQIVGQGANQTFPTLQVADGSEATANDTAIGHPNGDPNIEVDSGNFVGEAPFGSFDVTDNTVNDNPNRNLLEFANMDTQPGSSGSPIINSNGVVIAMDDLGDGMGDADGTDGGAILADIALAQQQVA